MLDALKASLVRLRRAYGKAFVHLPGIDTNDFGIKRFRKPQGQFRFSDSGRTD
jgi:hypothetical protein